MEGRSRASWWLVGILAAIVVVLLACTVATFAGGLAAWLVARQEWRSVRNDCVPRHSWAVPDLPRMPEVPFEMMGGAIVDNVRPGSPAEQAGLQRGDTIVAIDGRAIGLGDDLRELLSRYRPGDTIGIEIRRWRTGQAETVPVRLDSHPDDPNRPYLGIAYRTMPFMGGPGD